MPRVLKVHRQPGRLAISLLALMAILGAALGPAGTVMLRPAAAQPLCLGGTVWDPASQMCVPIEDAGTSAPPEPSLDPTPSPVADPTAPPTVAASDAGEPIVAPDASMAPVASPSVPEGVDLLPAAVTTAGLFAAVRTCREGPNWYAFADANAFRPVSVPLCTEPATPLVPFNVRVDGELVAMANATSPLSDGGMYALLSSLPPGDLTIVSTPPLGYGIPIVYCSIWRSSTATVPGAESRMSQRYYADLDGAIMIPAVRANENISCQWNNVPTAENVSAVIQGFQCPAGYDLYGAQPAELRTRCTSVGDNQEFMIFGPGGVGREYADANGYARFRGLISGGLRITGFQPDDASPPVVYCEWTGPEGQTLAAFDRQFPLADDPDTIAYTVDPLTSLACQWFFAGAGATLDAPDQTVACPSSTTPVASPDGLGITIGRAANCGADDAVPRT